CSSPCVHACVTGFGPFREHNVNASWVAVQELEKLGMGEDVDLKVFEIPVEYQKVQELVPSIWKLHNPQLMVHVGVSGVAQAVTLEQCGKNVGYVVLDNARCCPGSHCCVEGGPECLHSRVNMEAVRDKVRAQGLELQLAVSDDAGRYLCDYTYYYSLFLSHGKATFVHVPPLDKPYSAELLGHALKLIVQAMLEQLDDVQGDESFCVRL
uniref:Pyroglutamyl-peptidase I n=1 Tax=Petromyzon marinus TaxID=7757 RepID=S4R510_PETMA